MSLICRWEASTNGKAVLLENKVYCFVCVDLLRLVHVAGNDTPNIFSASGCVRAGGDVSNVAEGFKSHLIRLIGNLCYKNKDNQDKVRLFLRMFPPSTASYRIWYAEVRICTLFWNGSLPRTQLEIRGIRIHLADTHRVSYLFILGFVPLSSCTVCVLSVFQPLSFLINCQCLLSAWAFDHIFTVTRK